MTCLFCYTNPARAKTIRSSWQFFFRMSQIMLRCVHIKFTCIFVYQRCVSVIFYHLCMQSNTTNWLSTYCTMYTYPTDLKPPFVESPHRNTNGILFSHRKVRRVRFGMVCENALIPKGQRKRQRVINKYILFLLHII